MLKVIVAFILIIFSFPVQAGQLEEGLEAYKRNDKAMAMKILLPLAEAGDAKAQATVGQLYMREQKYKLGENWLLKAAEQGDAETEAWLGRGYFNGLILKRNTDEGLKWYRRAAEHGDMGSQWWLGNLYSGLIEGDWKKNYAEAMEWHRKAAEQGYLQSQLALGNHYAKGWGVTADQAAAGKWWQIAFESSQKETLNSIEHIAWRFVSGKQEYSQDFCQSLKWYGRAAEQGSITAWWQLGIAHEEGLCTAVDFPKAAGWYLKAAEEKKPDDPENRDSFLVTKKFRNQPNAQSRLGALYADGRGVRQDFVEAAKWWSIASEKSHVAAYKLGVLYEEGKGVQKNLQNALEWYRKSAKMGNGDAQLKLASILSEGASDKPKDEVEAAFVTLAGYSRDFLPRSSLYQLREDILCHESPVDPICKGRTAVSGQLAVLRKSLFKRFTREQFETLLKKVETSQVEDFAEMERIMCCVHSPEPSDLMVKEKAMAGSSADQYELGLRLEKAGDYAGAFEWFNKAANSGYPQGIRQVGIFYMAGRGVPVDIKEGYKYILLSDYQPKSLMSQMLLEYAEQKLSAEEIADIKKNLKTDRE